MRILYQILFLWVSEAVSISVWQNNCPACETLQTRLDSYPDNNCKCQCAKLNLSQKRLTCSRTNILDLRNALHTLENGTSLSEIAVVNSIMPVITGEVFDIVLPKKISIIDGYVGRVKPEAFSALASSLIHLNLADNGLSEIPASAFGPDSHLETLQLDKNHIKQIKKNDKSHLLKSVKSLSIRGNQVESIEDDAFEDLENLEFLDLSNNTLTKIDDGTFRGLKSLKYLNLENNQITWISRNAFVSSTNLERLNLGINRLVVFELDGPSSLRQMYLHNNTFSSVTEMTLLNMPHLHVYFNSTNTV